VARGQRHTPRVVGLSKTKYYLVDNVSCRRLSDLGHAVNHKARFGPRAFEHYSAPRLRLVCALRLCFIETLKKGLGVIARTQVGIRLGDVECNRDVTTAIR